MLKINEPENPGSKMSNEVKMYRNPQRKQPDTVKRYTPNYEQMGVEPQPYQGAKIVGNAVVLPHQPLPADNPRARRAPIRQPYAEAGPVPPIATGQLPNVGNSMEHSWSAVDGEITDDIGNVIDPNVPMVDNNDFVSNQTSGYQSGFTAHDLPTNQPMQGKVSIDRTVSTTNQRQNTDELLPIVFDLEDDSFLLIVANVPLCSGPKAEIEEQIQALILGTHEMCNNAPVPIDDVIVLKRVRIEAGVFLRERD